MIRKAEDVIPKDYVVAYYDEFYSIMCEHFPKYKKYFLHDTSTIQDIQKYYDDTLYPEISQMCDMIYRDSGMETYLEYAGCYLALSHPEYQMVKFDCKQFCEDHGYGDAMLPLVVGCCSEYASEMCTRDMLSSVLSKTDTRKHLERYLVEIPDHVKGYVPPSSDEDPYYNAGDEYIKVLTISGQERSKLHSRSNNYPIRSMLAVYGNTLMLQTSVTDSAKYGLGHLWYKQNTIYSNE